MCGLCSPAGHSAAREPCLHNSVNQGGPFWKWIHPAEDSLSTLNDMSHFYTCENKEGPGAMETLDGATLINLVGGGGECVCCDGCHFVKGIEAQTGDLRPVRGFLL